VQNNNGETSFFNNLQGPQNMWLFLCHEFKEKGVVLGKLRLFFMHFFERL